MMVTYAALDLALQVSNVLILLLSLVLSIVIALNKRK